MKLLFPFKFQVSGISFAFDPKKEPGKRVEQKFVKVGDEYIEKDKKYHMATKAYLVSNTFFLSVTVKKQVDTQERLKSN